VDVSSNSCNIDNIGLRKTNNKEQTLQLISIKTLLMNRDEVPPSHIYFSLLMEEWIMITFVMKNCLLDLFVVLDLDLCPIPQIFPGFAYFKKRSISIT
jgi:hypothetical protein